MSRPGLRKRSLLGFVFAFLVVLALALGLGIGLTRRSASSSNSSSNPSPGTGPSSSSTCSGNSDQAIVVSESPPHNASQTIQEAFISFAFEFNSFPRFAGNASSPNIFSNNLLNNIGNITGTKPYVRVGGNSQDQSLYSSGLPVAIKQNSTASQPSNQPEILNIGPSFFESYGTWPDTKFIHGFNMALVIGSDSDDAWATLLETVPLACEALAGGKLLWWEYGNEPDLYAYAGKGFVRPVNTWSDQNYLSQWNNGTQQIQSSLAQACPEMAADGLYGYIGPSLANPNSDLLTLQGVWSAGLENEADVKQISLHNYIGSTTDDGITLQDTLMSHTKVMDSLSVVVEAYQSLGDTGRPLVLGETNSLGFTGKANITNTFGAALWVMDYSLWCAAQNISRIHMEQGVNFLYNSWQPVQTPNVSIGTKAPYYGNIAVASMLGNTTASEVRIANIPLSSSHEAAYAAYSNDILLRIGVLNMRVYDASTDGPPRGHQNYTFHVPSSFNTATIQRLVGEDSFALDGITFDGYSYSFDLQKGMPVMLNNVTRGETLAICNGIFSVQLDDSSAVILELG